MAKTPQKKLLFEVSIIRPIVIGLLVLMHSFTKIGAAGGFVREYNLVDAYQWIVWLISGFRVETIALIAGYVFSYQSLDLGKKYKFCPFLVKKIKRLIIPMLVFGTFYYFCFLFWNSDFTFSSFIVAILSGCGHLWFLPMLFWCFIAIWAIDRYKLSSWVTLLLFAILTVIPLPPIPLGFGRLPHFLFYVFAGYFLWTKHGYVLSHWCKVQLIIIFWGLYISLVLIKHLFVPDINSTMTIGQKGIVYILEGGVNLLMSCSGILALYLTVCLQTMREGFRPKQWVIDASKDCYGVYVYHQFILVFIYFCTPLYSVCNTEYLLPWVGFILTLFISLVLTRLTLKTKFGRFLIG